MCHRPGDHVIGNGYIGRPQRGDWCWQNLALTPIENSTAARRGRSVIASKRDNRSSYWIVNLGNIGRPRNRSAIVSEDISSWIVSRVIPCIPSRVISRWRGSSTTAVGIPIKSSYTLATDHHIPAPCTRNLHFIGTKSQAGIDVSCGGCENNGRSHARCKITSWNDDRSGNARRLTIGRSSRNEITIDPKRGIVIPG